MPDKFVSIQVRFLKQNEGLLSKRSKTKEFSKLKDNEVEKFKLLFRDFLKFDGTRFYKSKDHYLSIMIFCSPYSEQLSNFFQENLESLANLAV
jgi:hypothetical protein